jgi:hypothetical protein
MHFILFLFLFLIFFIFRGRGFDIFFFLILWIDIVYVRCVFVEMILGWSSSKIVMAAILDTGRR